MPIGLLLRFLAEPLDPALLDDPASWSTIKQDAVRFGVATLVAYAARRRAVNQDRIWCDRVLASSWGRYEKSLRNLDWTLAVLEAEGIRPLTLKGPLLARRHYDPPFLRRPSADLDLAVRHRDLERASEALVRAGYELRMPARQALLRSHHVELSHPSRPHLELHFKLSHGPYGLSVDEFFDRAVPCKTPGGHDVLLLDPADEILHLALHFAHSSAVTLFHLCEIRRIWVAAPPAIRQEALRRAQQHHFAGVFALLDAAFKARWGEPLLTSEARFEHTWLHFQLNEKFYGTFERRFADDGPVPLYTQLSRKWLLLQMTDRPSDALRFASITARTALLKLPRIQRRG